MNEDCLKELYFYSTSEKVKIERVRKYVFLKANEKKSN